MLAGANRARSHWLGFIAVTAATINVVGGFLITDRMLKMFRREPKLGPGKAVEKAASREPGPMSARDLVIEAIYLAASVLFILGLKSLSHPDRRPARACSRPRWAWSLAIVGTLFHHEIIRFDFIAGR